jgi:hypothetical protein
MGHFLWVITEQMHDIAPIHFSIPTSFLWLWQREHLLEHR